MPEQRRCMGRKQGANDIAIRGRRTIVETVASGLTPTQVARHTVRSILYRYRENGIVKGLNKRDRKQK